MSALDRTLDDIIKSNKKSGGRGRGRPFGPGPARRSNNNRSSSRPDPYSSSKGYGGGKRVLSIEIGTKLNISSLDYGVSQEDIKELFSELGDLKRCVVHYDRSGRSKGTAEVVFLRRQDALSAVTKYNNVQLDGKPMKVVVVGTNIVTPGAGPPTANGNGSNFNGVSRSGQGRGGFGRSSGGSRGRGSGRGRASGRGRGEKLSQGDLDADLEKYHAESMQIN